MMDRLNVEQVTKQDEHLLELEQQEENRQTASPPATGSKQWKALYQELASYAQKLRNSNNQSI